MTALLLAASLLAMTQDTAWAPLERYLNESVARKAFPGAVVAVGRRDTVLYEGGFGTLGTDDSARPGPTTIYDLASLTKVVGLTTLAMLLVDEHTLDLDAPVTRYVPAFAAGGDSVTIRHLLTHASGLAAWQPLFREVHSRAEMFARVNATPLEAPPGTRTAYSDLGAILLTEVVEGLMGHRLDTLLEARVFSPLGMRDTRFLPPATLRARIAPTENDPWRGRVLRGEVHDENAAAMGGVSGHAGLFSTAADLVKFAQLLLQGGEGLVRPETIALFTRVQNQSFSSRALGWDTPSAGSSAGTKLSPSAFGHTGFTGTSIWIDPAQDLFIILLTNRVHPSRNNELIREVRPRVADLAVEAARR